MIALGVNVKVPFTQDTEEEARLREVIGDDGLQARFDGLAEDYWHSLEEQAQERFGVEVYQEGRSGGWAVPNPHIDPEEDAERFAEFRELAQGERDYYIEELWPQLVKEWLGEIEEQRERNIIRGTN